MMKWTGDWVSFIDGCLQLPIIHLHDMYLPTRLTTVIIDPEQHQKRLHSLEGDIQGTECQPKLSNSSVHRYYR